MIFLFPNVIYNAIIAFLQNQSAGVIKFYSNVSIIASKLRLNLDGDISFCDLPHVEPHCRDHVFTEMPRLNGKTEVKVISYKTGTLYY